MALRFYVVAVGQWPAAQKHAFTLVRDNWDDFHFKTTFQLHYRDSVGDIHEIGSVKIAKVGMGEDGGRTEIERSFPQLSEDYFSLGQDREYYDNLRKLPGSLGRDALSALRDVAVDLQRLDEVGDETVVTTSLMRDLDRQIIRTQFHWIAQGEAPRTNYHFQFQPPSLEDYTPDPLDFNVEVDSVPPTNTHVIIGANGVGKSTLMRRFASSLRIDAKRTENGHFSSSQPHTDRGRRVPFDNVVTVAFSAFDPFPAHLNDPDGTSGDIPHHVVGLAGAAAPGDREVDLADQFSQALRACVRSPRRERWLDALSVLNEADPLLQETEATKLIDGDVFGDEVWGASDFYRALSSGHKIALLTITALVRYVEERTLVLVDEPETHLHPPLLSALIRAVSRLTVGRNGVAIVATHSPVVLQNVPRSCVFLLNRSGDIANASRPRIETFGESVSVLTAEVFGLDVTDTGFHDVLQRAAVGFEQTSLGSQLGSEGRAVLRALADVGEKEDEI